MALHKIQEIERSGQLILTIPRNLANAINLVKGDLIDFKINSKGNIELIKIKEAPN